MVSIGREAFKGCECLASVTIGSSVRNIGESAFEECKSLTDVIIPDSVRRIRRQSFMKCENLINVAIGNNVKSIGAEAFRRCKRLFEIYIPNSVKIIGKAAFEECYIKKVILSQSTKYYPDSFDEITTISKACVFISYSWKDNEKEWVKKLASSLQAYGVHAIFDMRNVDLGDDLKKFMYEGITKAEKVICIMTPEYKRRAETRQGGVGEEYSIIKNEICRGGISRNKYIPILRDGDIEEAFTEEFVDSAYLDFKNDNDYNEKLEELVNSIFKRPSHL